MRLPTAIDSLRDGKIDDPKTLGILYEFPAAMVKSEAYLNPENFYVTNPNLGKSVSRSWLEDELKKHRHKTDGTFQQFLAKHLNIQIGMNLHASRWTGADFWERNGDKKVTLEYIASVTAEATAYFCQLYFAAENHCGSTVACTLMAPVSPSTNSLPS